MYSGDYLNRRNVSPVDELYLFIKSLFILESINPFRTTG